MIISHSCETSRGVEQTWPRSPISSCGAGSKCAENKGYARPVVNYKAIGLPIIPVPINPIFMINILIG